MASHRRAGRRHGRDRSHDDPARLRPCAPWVAWEQQMLYKQYDAMDAGAVRRHVPAVLHGQRVAARGPGCSPPAGSTPASGGPRTSSWRTGSTATECGWVWNPDAVGYHYADRPFDSWLRTARDYGVNEVVFGRDEEQDPTLSRVRAEFTRRSPVIRGLARACVAAPWLEPSARPRRCEPSPSAPTRLGCQAGRSVRAQRRCSTWPTTRAWPSELGGDGDVRAGRGGPERAETGAVMNPRQVWDDGTAVLRGPLVPAPRRPRSASRVRLRGRPIIMNHGRMVIGSRVQLVSTAAKLELVDDAGRHARDRRAHAGELRRIDRGRRVGADRRPLPDRHPRHHHGQRLPPHRARAPARVAGVASRSRSRTTCGSARGSSSSAA